MGVYSTLNITRQKALETWIAETAGIPSNKELESFMDDYLEPRLYNCRIVADGDDYNNDDEI